MTTNTLRAGLLLASGWLLLLFATAASAAPAAPVAASPPGAACFQAQADSDWQRYAALVLARDGRILDTGNGGISHSEGQGFGMRLAFHYNQRQAFERIWGWTQEHFYVRGDHLAAWRWRPDDKPHIDDHNNATDGDLFIAWSLALAGRCWDVPEYLDTARQIAADIRAKLVRETTAGTLLLPGAQGFEHDQTLTLNLSYWVFPAFAELARLEPDAAEWPALIASGQALLGELQFGRWKLPPDWVTWEPQAGFALPDQFPPRFGYDAVRVPLYWVWHGQTTGHELDQLAAYWHAQQDWSWAPDWVDLKTDAISSNPAPSGIAAIAALTQFAVVNGTDGDGAALLRLVPLPTNQDAGLDYYSASLRLLTGIAGRAWYWQQCKQGSNPGLGTCGDGR
ncbi:glycosyl hydrolase family 8 [Rhabdochromatium marinum]|uniref:glycosyl hydrolase family 8 n=1 Tax=Rhabdochromatium marinum TaxID=48729 RepID=UPI0019035BC4|nr:glycosyl hydrolase family 8 [Rhabdochromatium marinum]MBK1649242.1 hypothetical protein [Rhabdochromatium marinum]